MARPTKFIPPLSEKDKRRFFAKLKINESTGCHEWQAYMDQCGYGIFRLRERIFRSHRVAYFLNFDQPLGDFFVCHRCDNPCCCNPEHLFLGTHEDNLQDMVKKGRSSKGIARPNSKLTETDIFKIRDLCAKGVLTRRQIADQFGVSKNYISNISSCSKWTHLTRPCDLEAAESRRANRHVFIGEKHPQAILKDKDVLKIRELHAAGGITQTRLGELFGVHRTNIYAILKRKSWASL